MRLLDQMLPAQAGVILQYDKSLFYKKYAPRAGGGDPGKKIYLSGHIQCSPRRRG